WWSMGLPVCPLGTAWSLLGSAGRSAGRGDRDAEADTDEEVLPGRVGERGDDPDDLPGPVEQRPAAVARVDRRVELDEPVQCRPAWRADAAVRGRDDARGQTALQTQRVTDGEDGVAHRWRPGQDRGDDDLGQPVDGEDGDVVLRFARRDARAGAGAIGELDLDLRRAVDDVQGGQDGAARVDDHAGAQPGAATGLLGRDGDERGADGPVRDRGIG